MLNGEGIINNKHAIYEGTFKDNKLHGKGQINFHVNKKGRDTYFLLLNLEFVIGLWFIY